LAGAQPGQSRQAALDAGPEIVPAHVGIIMDGNGRWAEERGLPRLEGHREGSNSVREVTRTARRIGLQALTLYAFSAQNWSRPADEVAGLMDLLREYLESERQEILENGIRLEAVGELDRLPRFVRALEAVGKKRWNRRVARVVAQVLPIFNPRRLYLGGGNAKHLDIQFPPEVHLVANIAGLLGGIALWRRTEGA